MRSVRSRSIGALARASGVNLETIRYYERIGLMPAPGRTEGGHRVYETTHGQRLRFIRRARELGFGIEAVRALLALSERAQPCEAVRRVAADQLAQVRAKLADLTRLERVLADTVAECRPDQATTSCAVLEMLDAG